MLASKPADDPGDHVLCNAPSPLAQKHIVPVRDHFSGLRDRMGNKGLQWRILFTRNLDLTFKRTVWAAAPKAIIVRG